MAPSDEGKPSHEATPRQQDFFTHYEQSKAEARRKPDNYRPTECKSLPLIPVGCMDRAC